MKISSDCNRIPLSFENNCDLISFFWIIWTFNSSLFKLETMFSVYFAKFSVICLFGVNAVELEQKTASNPEQSAISNAFAGSVIPDFDQPVSNTA